MSILCLQIVFLCVSFFTIAFQNKSPPRLVFRSYYCNACMHIMYMHIVLHSHFGNGCCGFWVKRTGTGESLCYLLGEPFREIWRLAYHVGEYLNGKWPVWSCKAKSKKNDRTIMDNPIRSIIGLNGLLMCHLY